MLDGYYCLKAMRSKFTGQVESAPGEEGGLPPLLVRVFEPSLPGKRIMYYTASGRYRQ